MKKSKQISTVIILIGLFSILAYPQPSSVHITTSGIQSETAITADPNNPNHLMAAWNDIDNNNHSHPGFSFSVNGGQSCSHQI